MHTHLHLVWRAVYGEKRREREREREREDEVTRPTLKYWEHTAGLLCTIAYICTHDELEDEEHILLHNLISVLHNSLHNIHAFNS